MKGWRGPEFEDEFPTLGWQVVDWIHSLGLVVPAGRRAGEPLVLRESQEDFFVDWYRLDPASGRFVYRRGYEEGGKGSGKSPSGSLLCLTEFDGPAVFDGWDAGGEPVGVSRPDSLVNIVANSEEQTGNMYDWLYELLYESAAAEEFGWDVQLGGVSGRKGGYKTIEPRTSSPRSTAGVPVTFVAKEETWLWFKSNGGTRLSRAINNNAHKNGARTCEFTNPPEKGLGSVAEITAREVERGAEGYLGNRRPGVLHKSIREGGIKLAKNERHVRAAIRSSYGDAMLPGGWVDEDDIYAGVLDEENSESDGYRLFLGHSYSGGGKLVDPDRWYSLAAPDRRIEDGATVALGFDGSFSRDASALVACELGSQHCELVELWERPAGAGTGAEWRVPRGEVRAAVERCRDRWRCLVLVADPGHYWRDTVEDWGEDWGEIYYSKVRDQDRKAYGFVCRVEMNTQPRVVDDVVGLVNSLLESDGETFTHSDDDRLTRHVLAMLATRGGSGAFRRVDKASEGADDRIDAGVAWLLALWGAVKLKTVTGGGSGGSIVDRYKDRGGGQSSVMDAARRVYG